MIEETASVIAVDGDVAWVESERRSSCGSCSAKGCGTGALSKVLGSKVQRLRVKNPVGAKVGDSVMLGIEERTLLQGSLLVYLMPLLSLLAGGLIGEKLAPQWGVSPEGASVVFAVLGLVASLIWLRGYNRRYADDPRFTAVILRRLPVEGLEKPINLNL